MSASRAALPESDPVGPRARAGRALLLCLALVLPGVGPLLAAGAPPAGAPPAPAADHLALRRACAWLWARQGPDGGWHSETYGLLASGQALTPFVLDALLRVPETVAPRPPGGVQRALGFLRARVGPDGRVGLSIEGLPEYPTYATATTLLCLARAGDPADAPLVARLRAALLAAQLGPDLPPDHVAGGGWGFGVRPPGHPGHMDVAHTRHALEALRRSGGVPPAARGPALRFLGLLQKDPAQAARQPLAGEVAPVVDGGFYFSPVVLPASKGGALVSYASATCDGLLALLAAGLPGDDPRVRAAAGWLERHPRLDRPEGIPAPDLEGWADSLTYYHLAARAEAWAALDRPGPWRDEARALLAAWQRPDGSFMNPAGQLMKEDDPLLATTFALIALAE